MNFASKHRGAILVEDNARAMPRLSRWLVLRRHSLQLDRCSVSLRAGAPSWGSGIGIVIGRVRVKYLPTCWHTYLPLVGIHVYFWYTLPFKRFG
jgi:hypothetical protein